MSTKKHLNNNLSETNNVIPTKVEMKKKLLLSFQQQGYIIDGNSISLPKNFTKEDLRKIQQQAVKRNVEKKAGGLRRFEERLIEYIANGTEVIPEMIEPKLVPVQSGTEQELLFRYASVHWSIPISSGYGRRMRFLLMDKSNGKLMGIFALGDPVFGMKQRDEWIGWDKEDRRQRLYHVMDAFVLGAVPPYSNLLCGKFVALSILSDEVRKNFRKKYEQNTTLISREIKKPILAMVTTTSALGRSSIYNRLKVDGTTYWHNIGFTQGSGEFHFSNGIYEELRAFVSHHCDPTMRHKNWGSGFRNKREIVVRALQILDLPKALGNHGIKRQIFAAPLGNKTNEFLRGESKRVNFYGRPLNDLFEKFKYRWLLPRAQRMTDWKNFQKETYLIWHDNSYEK